MNDASRGTERSRIQRITRIGLMALGLVAAGVGAKAATPPRTSRAAAIPDTILRSGRYTIRIRESVMGGGEGKMRISRNGRPLVTLRGWMIYPYEIRPLLGPHSPDLVVRTFSGGLHWSSVYYIVHLGPRLRSLLTFDARNYDRIEFGDLDHDGRQEIIAWDDSFAYFDDLDFADSPSLPFVFRYERGRYRDATARFRWLVKADQDKAKSQLVAAVRRIVTKPTADQTLDQLRIGRELSIHGAAVSVYADGLLLRRAGEAERWLRLHLPAEDREWFLPLRGSIRHLVGARDRKLTYRIRELPPYWPY